MRRSYSLEGFIPPAEVRSLAVGRTWTRRGEGDLIVAPEPLSPAEPSQVGNPHPDRRHYDDLDFWRAERDSGKARDGSLAVHSGEGQVKGER
jgi:hypothetical protein